MIQSKIFEKVYFPFFVICFEIKGQELSFLSCIIKTQDKNLAFCHAFTQPKTKVIFFRSGKNAAIVLLKRNEIDTFHKLFKKWLATFEKDDCENEWGLFL